MKIILLVGGSGSRLWPLSRQEYPKQFLNFGDKVSLFQHAFQRAQKLVSNKDIIIVTNDIYVDKIYDELRNIQVCDFHNIVCEPCKRNTAPAIMLGLAYIESKLTYKKNESIFILLSDHYITPENKFINLVQFADKCIKKFNNIITFGIKPFCPHTGYGYIKIGDKKNMQHKSYNLYEVSKFVEKPNLDVAKKYILSGEYVWNSGMFGFNIDMILREFKKYNKKIYNIYNLGFKKMLQKFETMPDISIDYALIEKTKNIQMIPFDIFWSDIGSWDAVYDILDKDENNNVIYNNVLLEDTKESFIYSQNKRLITTIDIHNLFIVDTKDALLICNKGKTQKVKNIVERLKLEHRQEVIKHSKKWRVWGNYEILDKGDVYTVKKIELLPHKRISLQKHQFRNEHWNIIQGVATVYLGKEKFKLKANESISIPKNTKHMVVNETSKNVIIIENQIGDIDESDIVRFE